MEDRSSVDPMAGPAIRRRLIEVSTPKSSGANESHPLSRRASYGGRVTLIPAVALVVRPLESYSCVNVKDTNAAVRANDDLALVQEADRHDAANLDGDRLPMLHVGTIAR
jgi:hypothetical protein